MSAFSKCLKAGFILGAGCGAVLADTDIQPGISVAFEHQHQEFSKTSANAKTIDIAPDLQVGNWNFSLDVPWISADSNYVNNKYPSRLVTACDDPQAVYNKHPRYWNRKFGSESAAIAYLTSLCQKSGVVASGDTVSGMSDITAFAHYGLPLDDEGTWLLSFGLGYKFDNGDVDKNLGSGTRNTMLETSLSANYGMLSGSLTGGYAFVNGGDELTDGSHYAYGAADIGVSPLAWLTIGCNVDYSQSYVSTSDDVTKKTAYIKFKPWKYLRLKVYGTDYGNASGYPDREYGGSVSFVY